MEGFYIRYRDMSGGSQKFNMKTVLNQDQVNYFQYKLLNVFLKKDFLVEIFHLFFQSSVNNFHSISLKTFFALYLVCK